MRFKATGPVVLDARYSSMIIYKKHVHAPVEVIVGDYINSVFGNMYRVDFIKGDLLLVSCEVIMGEGCLNV